MFWYPSHPLWCYVLYNSNKHLNLDLQRSFWWFHSQIDFIMELACIHPTVDYLGPSTEKQGLKIWLKVGRSAEVIHVPPTREKSLTTTTHSALIPLFIVADWTQMDGLGFQNSFWGDKYILVIDYATWYSPPSESPGNWCNSSVISEFQNTEARLLSPC